MKSPWGTPSLRAWEFILDSTAAINIAWGAVRSGKTVASLIRWAEYVDSAPPGDLLIAGKTERTLRRNVIHPLQDYLGPRRMSVSWGLGEGYILGRRAYLVGANDARAEGRLRGVTLAGAYGDELTLWPGDFFRMLTSRLSVQGAVFIGTTNPDTPQHWLRKEFLDREEEMGPDVLRSWRFGLADNPYLSSAYVENLRAMHHGMWRRRYIEGEWCAGEGAIYDCFDPVTHVFDRDIDLPRPAQWYVAADYGTANPCTWGLYCVGRKGKQPVVLLIDEYYYSSAANDGRQKTDAEYVADMRAFLGSQAIEAIIVDPSASSFIAALRAAGYPVRLARNDVLDGIRTVASFLAAGRYKIHASCLQTIREYQSYSWDATAALKSGQDRPRKVDDHTCDRDRYLMYTLFGHDQALPMGGGF